MYSADMGHWVTRRKMLEFVDRLKHPLHRDYDTIREIGQLIEDFQDDDTVIGKIVDASGYEYETIAHIADDLKERNALVDLIDEQESAAFVGEEDTPVVDRLKAGLADAEKRSEAYWEIRGLCVDAGLIRPDDRTTDPLPLLRMFLPV